METTYADSWSDTAKPCDMDLCVMKWRSAWPVFHDPVILPYILKTVWYMYIIFWEYESVWPWVWPQNKCRSVWPIFHGPMILLISWRRFDVWTSLFGIMNRYDPMFDCKINVGRCDLYFMVQWFCLISWRLFDVWTSLFEIMNQYDLTFDSKIKCRSLRPIFHGPLILHYILKTVWCMSILIWDYESVWPDVLPQNKCSSLWPIFHGPVILPYISKTIWWICVIFSDYETVWLKRWPQNKYRSKWPTFHGLVILLNIFKIIWWINITVGLMDQCDTKIDLIKYI